MKKVLIADDEDSIAQLLRKFIEQTMSLNCEVVNDGMAALAEIRTGSYFFVISDFQMPGMDGIDVAKACFDSGISFAISSGRKDILENEAEERLGVELASKVMANFFQKPFSLSILSGIINKAMAV